MDHPNIIKCYEYYEDKLIGTMVIILEFS